MKGRAGFVRLHRKLQDNPVWTQLSPAVFKVFSYFVMNANWQETKWFDGTQEVLLPRGSFATSYATVASDCRISLKQTRDAFADLKNLRIAAYTRAYRYQLVKVLNYNTYNPPLEDAGQPPGQFEVQLQGRIGAPVKEVKETTKEKTTTTASKNGTLPQSVDWPLTIQQVKRFYPTTDEKFIRSLVASCLKIFPDLTDADLADGVAVARRDSPNQKSAGLFVRTVPEVIRTWAGKKAQA